MVTQMAGQVEWHVRHGDHDNHWSIDCVQK